MVAVKKGERRITISFESWLYVLRRSMPALPQGQHAGCGRRSYVGDALLDGTSWRYLRGRFLRTSTQRRWRYVGKVPFLMCSKHYAPFRAHYR